MEKPSGDGFSSTLASLLTGVGELANVRVLYTRAIFLSILLIRREYEPAGRDSTGSANSDISMNRFSAGEHQWLMESAVGIADSRKRIMSVRIKTPAL